MLVRHIHYIASLSVSSPPSSPCLTWIFELSFSSVPLRTLNGSFKSICFRTIPLITMLLVNTNNPKFEGIYWESTIVPIQQYCKFDESTYSFPYGSFSVDFCFPQCQFDSHLLSRIHRRFGSQIHCYFCPFLLLPLESILPLINFGSCFFPL